MKRVLKFGGSSLATASHLSAVIEIVSKKQEECILLVVSAFSGVTDQLIEMGNLAAKQEKRFEQLLESLERRHVDTAKSLINDGELRSCILSNIQNSIAQVGDLLQGVFLLRELSPRTLDFLMSFGEMLSAYVLSEAFKAKGLSADFLDARELLKSDENFGNARLYFERSYQNIKEYFQDKKPLQVVTGFIASTFNGETSTLGRGGSDFTASIFARALEVEEVEIWTDVDGVMTADPRKVKNAFPISRMSYEEAMEMSHFGAKVLHPPTMHPAVEKDISIIIKNSFNPGFPGTMITAGPLKNGHPIRGISSIDEIALIRVQGPGMVGIAGTSHRIFGALAKKKINIILITQASSEHSICLAVPPEDAWNAKREIEEEFSLEIYAHEIEEVIVEKGVSVIAVVGENMHHVPGIAAKVFSALGQNSINVIAIAQGSSELNISLVVKKEEELKALNVIHDAFFCEKKESLSLFILGSGSIGSTLFTQICEQKKKLLEMGIDLSLKGLADSKNMVFDDNGIEEIGWRERLKYSPLKMDISRFISFMKESHRPIFVDCTASEEIADFYESILDAGISIVTPNKAANSGSYARWKALQDTARRRNCAYLYEANVGAGLPLIRTLRSLLDAGDKVIKIEAVLSGSLSYVFNHLSHETSFSKAFQEAIEKGYTEPDPKRDLQGLDVQRKILILARESGYELEPSDVQMEELFPAAMIEGIEDFQKALKILDSFFQERLEKAQGRVLRFVAVFENGKAKVSLKEFGPEHPFASLCGSDNMLVLKTERYRQSPLLIQGPGAGALVTAGAVFSDIILASGK